ncbi:hypothetical protein PMm318_A40010 [Pseudomonas moorei]
MDKSMSDDIELQAKRQSLGEQTLSITVDQFMDYIQHKKSDGPCESCGSIRWIYVQDNGRPAIMGTQNVRNDATSNWFFWMVCGSCSSTRMIAAGPVWEHYFAVKGLLS